MEIGNNEEGHLRSFVERIESLEEEKAARADDIKEVYGEAKSSGFDPPTIRKIVARRKKDSAKLAEEEAIFAIYLKAMGMAA